MSARPAQLAGHGGRLCVARALYPHAPEPWIDLSTGINPEAYPAAGASAEARARLPMREEIRALEAVAGRAFGMAEVSARMGASGGVGADCDLDANRIAAVAGSEAALRLMPYVLRLSTVFVVGPTYTSHAAAWSASARAPTATAAAALTAAAASATARAAPAAASEAVAAAAPNAGWPLPATRKMPLTANGIALNASNSLDVAVRSAQLAATPSVITLVNPNNPDGTVASRAQLLTAHDEIALLGGYLVVDEAFADVDPACSVAAAAGNARYPRLVVLRSFGKFYGLAGVRLGFVIAAPSIITRFRELLGDWPVSADAIAAGMAAYADDAWAARTRERLLHAARRLDDLLISSGLEIIGGTTLFRLARATNARDRFDQLLRAGILTRPFDHDPTLLRFGLPHGAAWQRLAEALRTP